VNILEKVFLYKKDYELILRNLEAALYMLKKHIEKQGD